MPRLIEQTVQVIAQEFLAKRYRWKARGRMYSQLEARTKRSIGGKRADGLLVFNHWIWGAYTISMEAKSYKTLPAVKPFFDTRNFIIRCLQAGLVTLILSGSFQYFYTLDDRFAQFLLPIVIFLIGTLIFGLLSFKSFRNYQVKVIDQIAQYPANEQWLAISIDTFHKKNKKQLKRLEAVCSRCGVGLLIVNGRAKVEIRVKPRTRWTWWSDFVGCYAKEKEIRAYL